MDRITSYALIFAINLSAAFPLSAGPFEGKDLSYPPAERSFVTPNEQNPQQAQQLLKKATAGVYVSVGTERGLLGFAMAQNATHLLLVDRDRHVVDYNRLNVVLIKASRSSRDLFWLRTQASWADWKHRISETPDISSKEAKLINKKNYQAWQEQNKDVFMREFHENHSDSFFDKPFKAVNYLFNEELYSRIKQAALEKRIDIRQAGLTDSEFIKGLGAQLEKSGLLLSVLDISNAWENMYIPRKSFREAILQYAKLGGSDSLLLMTGVSFASQFRDSILEMYSWGYFALSFPVAERIHRSCWATRLYRFSLLLTKSGINGLPWFFHKSPIGGSRCSQSVAQ